MCRVLWLYRSVAPALLAMASDQQQPECKEFWMTLAEVTHYLTQDGHEHVFHEWGVTPGSKRNGREALLSYVLLRCEVPLNYEKHTGTRTPEHQNMLRWNKFHF